MENRNTRRGNTQIPVHKKGHSRGMLSGIYNVCRCQIKAISLLNGYVEDPRQKHSGMTLNFTTAYGFTLVELLVVVLIIGILAAVAVPQYQKAVMKSRATEALVLANSLQKAFDVYVLEKGIYDADDTYLFLDIEFPKTSIIGETNYCTQCSVIKDFVYGGECRDNSCWFDIAYIPNATKIFSDKEVNVFGVNAQWYLSYRYTPESGWTKSYTQTNDAKVDLKPTFSSLGFTTN